jgi:hypothetical protein
VNLLIGFELISINVEMNGEVGNFEDSILGEEETRGYLILLLLNDNTTTYTEIPIKPSVPQTTTIKLNTSLIVFLRFHG